MENENGYIETNIEYIEIKISCDNKNIKIYIR